MFENLSAYIKSRSDAGLIFIVSYNDVVGSRVTAKLLEAGYPQVRVGIGMDSDASVFKDLVGKGANLVKFDWDCNEDFATALCGVRTVFCDIPTDHENWQSHFPVFLEACRKAGVKHFVKLSFFHALDKTRIHIMKNFHVSLPAENEFTRVPLIKMHGDCDELLIKCNGIDYTILFATHLMSTPLVTQKQHLKNCELYGCAPANSKVSYISPNDVAECAAKILVRPEKHARVGYHLCGPLVTDEQVAQAIGKSIHKDIKYRRVPLATFEKEEETKEGEPSFVAHDLVALEKMKASGIEADFHSNDLERVCGHAAETFDEYLSATNVMSNLELVA